VYEAPKCGASETPTGVFMSIRIFPRSEVFATYACPRHRLQAQCGTRSERQVIGHLDCGAEPDRRCGQPIAVELRVQAIREVLLALVVEERVDGREVPRGNHRVHAEREVIFERLDDESERQIVKRVVPRARGLARSRPEAFYPFSRAPQLQIASRIGFVVELLEVSVGRIFDARGNVELWPGTSIDGDPDLLSERHEAHVQLRRSVGEQRGIEIGCGCATRNRPSLQATSTLRIAHELEQGRCFRSARPQRHRARANPGKQHSGRGFH